MRCVSYTSAASGCAAKMDRNAVSALHPSRQNGDSRFVDPIDRYYIFRISQIFKTTNRGWGLKTLDLIPTGSFVMKYIGEVYRVEDLSPDDVFSFSMTQRPDYTDDHKSPSHSFASHVSLFLDGCRFRDMWRRYME